MKTSGNLSTLCTCTLHLPRLGYLQIKMGVSLTASGYNQTPQIIKVFYIYLRLFWGGGLFFYWWVGWNGPVAAVGRNIYIARKVC